MADINKYHIPEKFINENIYSFSRLGTYKRCEYEYFLNYIKKEKSIDNIYGTLGGRVHELIGDIYMNKITNEKAIKEFNNAVLESTLKGMYFPTKKTEENFLENIRECLKKIKCPYDIGTFELEKEVYIKVFEKYVFMGFIDLVITNPDGTIDIGDFKTSTKFAANEIDEKGFQLLLYGMAMEQQGYKVKNIFWNMLKYCNITWQGKTKMRVRTAERQRWVSSIANEILKDLQDMSKTQSELLLSYAVEHNTLENMPPEIQNKYKVTDCIVTYPYTTTKKELFYHYIMGIIPYIEAKS